VDSTASILETLDRYSIPALHDRLAALPSRYAAVSQGAATLLEPKAQFISLASSTLRTEAEFDSWIAQKRKEVLEALKNGPVVIK
jgi:hypothetical protein